MLQDDYMLEQGTSIKDWERHDEAGLSDGSEGEFDGGGDDGASTGGAPAVSQPKAKRKRSKGKAKKR